MRSMRMIAALLLLQSRGRVTAAELADELEVSVATARRDLEALGSAGVPVYPQPGRGGGWQLVGGARTDLSGLTAGESRALFLLLGSGADASEVTRSAVRKLVRALPGPFQADAEAAAAAVRSDSTSWGAAERDRPPMIRPLQQAIVDRRRIMIDYDSRSGARGRRRVAPLGMIDKDGIWYLIGICDTDDQSRTYRVDRIADLEITDETFPRPRSFDLAASWRAVTERVEGERGRVSATVLVDRRRIDALHARFGRYFTTGDDHDPGADRVRATVAAQSDQALAEQLAGWQSVLEVVSPDSVRSELAEIGRQLIQRYG